MKNKSNFVIYCNSETMDVINKASIEYALEKYKNRKKDNNYKLDYKPSIDVIGNVCNKVFKKTRM